MKKNNAMQAEKISLGTCYYPEHWDESLWESDLKRMQACGIETIRIAEFAWSKFEPEEGIFTFDFFDRFLEAAAKAGMKVIFCTPTATPPAWLTEKYPEVLNATREGIRIRHGSRRHYNYNSQKYQELSVRIVEKIAEHYAPHPGIVGWQLDNEFNCETDLFYSESDTEAFRIFLQQKYGSLDALNRAWGTVFWNQTYTQWSQVYVPRTTIGNVTNPHMELDYFRFISDSVCRYAKLQSDIVRKYLKEGDFITTNGMFGNLDNHRMTEESLDFYMYDSYPNFAYAMRTDPKNSDDLNDRKWSRNLSEVRSVSPNFGIMEQQSGPGGWNCRMEAPAPKPGQMTLWTMQSIAHGADFVSYFRWRTCTMGTEIYWHGILDYSGRDNRRLKEVETIHQKIQSMKAVAGSRYKAEVGVVKDYDNAWDARLDVWHGRVDKVSQKGIFEAAQLTHTPLDYIYLTEGDGIEKLVDYQVLFYPHASILTKERVALLKEYVNNGGILVLGSRTGYKEQTGQCVMEKLPGLFREAVGTDVVDYTFVGPGDDTVYVKWEDSEIEAAVFHDILEPLTEDAEVLGIFTSNYYKGQPGLIRNSYGKGAFYYFGGAFTRETAKVFLEKLGVSSPYDAYVSLPEMCELAVREKDGVKYVFLLNYAHEGVTVQWRKEAFDMFLGQNVVGEIKLEAYEARVYTISTEGLKKTTLKVNCHSENYS